VTSHDTYFDVVIVGAGPVGLTLALDLAQRHVKVLLAEKNAEPLRLPKMERSNPRTMEIWRRLGVVDEIRAVGLPAHMPMDVLVVRDLVSEPLVRQAYPSVAKVREQIAACTDGSLPREPYQLVSQYEVEPVLMARCMGTPGLEIRRETTFRDLKQDADGVTAEFEAANGARYEVRSQFLVGCDGGGSTVRKAIGVTLQGRAGIGTIYNIFFRCDDFLDKCRVGFARHYCFAGLMAGGGAGGTIVVQGDMKHLAMHIMTEPPDDPARLLREVTRLDIHPHVYFAQPWTQHMLVADRHQVGRVFLAGDANHLFIPAGGLGMNTGIGDAINLGWKLSAVLQGWGGPELLESYHAERNATAHRNLKCAQWAVEGVIDWRNGFDPIIDEDSPEGRAARTTFIARAEKGNRRVYEMHGADLGYRYVSSVIDPCEGPAPECPITRYEPTTWPGAHLPHVWLGPGESIYDRLSTRAYTLLTLGDRPPDTAGLKQAFRKWSAPLEVMHIRDPRIRAVYEHDLILVRPDFHVAWRGNVLPSELAQLAARVTGQSSMSAP
jgi:2-polyprenyl-6-methoxyphenol hydroxylase-like FAD-dependent oxidoreductase